jgi:ankyrin repeat protein
MMLEAFPGAAKVADDEGYLPLHLALDCARPNPVIAKMLLDHYPESAFHKSKDGLLPIHCIISSLNPVIEVIELLLQIFPDSTESMAVDVIPGKFGTSLVQLAPTVRL